jgi:hypothetical protein
MKDLTHKKNINICKSLIFFLLVFVALQYSSLLFYGYKLLQIKYLSVNILGNISSSFLIIYAFYNIKKSLILLYSLLPLLTWYKSVYFIYYDIVTLDPFLILFIFYSMFLFYLFVIQDSKLNRFMFTITLLLFARFLFGITMIHSNADIYFVINEFLEPFLFSAILMLTYSVYKHEIISFFELSLKGLLATSFIILITEMVLRSGGKPWLFLIYGGRKGYAGTTGDLTAGFGEPVTMGLFATFLFFYFFFFYRNKLILFYLFFLSLLSIAKSAILAFGMIFIFIFIAIKKRLWKLIPKVYIMLALIVSLPLIYVVYQRLLGVGKIDTATSMSLGGIAITSDVNLIRNIKSAISWADPYFDIDWYMQFLMLPFVGGVDNVVYLEKNIFVFLTGVFFVYVIAYHFIVKGNFYTRAVGTTLLLIYSYYGAFTGNPYAYFYLVDKESALGYAPRSEPSYLLLILLFVLEISKYKFNNLTLFLKGNYAKNPTHQ